MSNYTRLNVWEKAHHLTLSIYKVTADFPKEELYGIVLQMRRASSSIPMNIAEGHGRRSKREYSQFVNIARGSAMELEYQLMLCKDLGYLSEEQYNLLDSNCKEVLKMLNGLLKALQDNPQ